VCLLVEAKRLAGSLICAWKGLGGRKLATKSPLTDFLFFIYLLLTLDDLKVANGEFVPAHGFRVVSDLVSLEVVHVVLALQFFLHCL